MSALQQPEVLPRNGLLGLWDRIVGPGMTAAETRLVLLSSVLGGLFASVWLAKGGTTVWQCLLAFAVGFDVFGGAVCNATETTKHWYHRAGQGFLQHALFLAPHLAYLALVAAIWRGPDFDGFYVAVGAAVLTIGSAAVMLAPNRTKRPVAFLAFLVGLLTIELATGPTLGLEWFVPALLLKLLVGHLVPSPARQSPP